MTKQTKKQLDAEQKEHKENLKAAKNVTSFWTLIAFLFAKDSESDSKTFFKIVSFLEFIIIIILVATYTDLFKVIFKYLMSLMGAK